MRRLSYATIAMMIAIALIFVLLGCLKVGEGEQIEVQSAGGANVPYYTFLDVTDLEEDTWYVLVDLDDVTNFSHKATNAINLKQLCYTGVLSNATRWDVQFGVVGEITGTSAFVEWIHVMHRTKATQFDEKWTLPEHGLDLSFAAVDDMRFVASKEYTYTTGLTTTLAIESPVTASNVVTTYAEAGDLVMFVQEVDTGGYIEGLSIGTCYNTR